MAGNGTPVRGGGDGFDDSVVCYTATNIIDNAAWHGDDPTEYALPVFIMQLTCIVVITRLLVVILKPLRQPRVVAEIIGGIVLGPSVLGKWQWFADNVFPLKSVLVLETMANVGLLYFLFLVGLEMDLSVLKNCGKKAINIALCGMIVPFIIGTSFATMMSRETGVPRVSFLLFLGVAVSVTAFPVLARILAELKLLNTELGRIAMSSALVNDMCAWVILAVAIALAEKNAKTWASLAVIATSIAFVLFCIFVVRPAINWIIKQTPEGEACRDVHVCLILTGVALSGFITDFIGTHSIFGAFVYGLVIPNGPLGATLIEKLEDFVTGLLLPLFFAISGLRTNIESISESNQWAFLLLIIILACAAKVGVTLLLSIYYQMPIHEGIALGLLMNTKGLIEMIVLNVGRDQKVLNDQSFAVMVLVSVATTSIITPTIMAVYKPARRFLPYKRRTIQMLKPDSELRVLSCIHMPRNVPTIINLLEASNPTKKSPIHVNVLHLVELTGRSSAMLIVHNTRKSGGGGNRTQAQSDHIINSFETFEQNATGVTVQPLTAISPYSTMHEDICNLAEDKRVALVILPFHKQQTVDGGMESTNPAYRTINQNVLANAPCSVGILVDRGLGGSARVAPDQICHHVVVLFFGGPDDREALSYAFRMAEHPGISLTVIRFIPGEEAVRSSFYQSEPKDPSSLTVKTGKDKEKQSDEDFLNNFRFRTVNNESVVFIERAVNNGEETVATIRDIDSIHDLYIVGRGQGISPLIAGLTDWSECPELGVIGDLLASSDFAGTVSVLVVQQYVGTGLHDPGTPNSPGQHNEFYSSMHNAFSAPTLSVPPRSGSGRYGSHSWNA